MPFRSPLLTRRRAVLAGSAALTALASTGAQARGGTLSPAQVDTLTKALADAPSHGFRKTEFMPADLADAMKSGAMQTPAAQAKLKAAILAYARAQRGQRLAPSQFLDEWSVRPAPYDPTPEFNAAVGADRLQPWLDSLPPRYQGYQAAA